jgi:hypothetical protein
MFHVPSFPEMLVISVFLLSLVLWVLALVDVVRRQFRDPNAKLIWVLIVVFAHGIGALVYLVFGRKQGSLPTRPTAA